LEEQPEIRYRRARFSTRLPTNRLYPASHFWLEEIDPGRWKVGFTRFATRMLGEIVEFGFEPAVGDEIALGKVIGSVEAFKAITQIYSILNGRFGGPNPALDKDITLIDSDCYGKGWLYTAEGEPDERSVSAEGYVEILDTTIDGMLAEQHNE
jgi:glycine cleavage system H protein